MIYDQRTGNQGNCNVVLAKESRFTRNIPVVKENVKAFYGLNYLENCFRLPEHQYPVTYDFRTAHKLHGSHRRNSDQS